MNVFSLVSDYILIIEDNALDLDTILRLEREEEKSRKELTGDDVRTFPLLMVALTYPREVQ